VRPIPQRTFLPPPASKGTTKGGTTRANCQLKFILLLQMELQLKRPAFRPERRVESPLAVYPPQPFCHQTLILGCDRSPRMPAKVPGRQGRRERIRNPLPGCVARPRVVGGDLRRRNDEHRCGMHEGPLNSLFSSVTVSTSNSPASPRGTSRHWRCPASATRLWRRCPRRHRCRYRQSGCRGRPARRRG
jgi:hypothetical protein